MFHDRLHRGVHGLADEVAGIFRRPFQRGFARLVRLVKLRLHMAGEKLVGLLRILEIRPVVGEHQVGAEAGDFLLQALDLGDGVEGYLAARDVAKERIDDVSAHLKVGEKVEAKFIGMDRKGRMLQLSIRAKDEDELAETLSDYQDAGTGTTKLGALLKEQMNRSE